MRTKIYYFTGTGNSLAVARDIANKLDARLISIPSLLKNKRVKIDAEVIGIIFPVYFAAFGGVPLIVEKFINKLEGLTNKYIFAICTHAGGPRDTINHLKDLLESRGGHLDAGFTIKMSIPYSVGVKLKRALFKRRINSQEEIIKDSRQQQDLYELCKKKLDEIVHHINHHDRGPYENERVRFEKVLSPLIKLSRSTFRSRYKKLAEIGSDNSDKIIHYSFENLINLADKSFEVNDHCNGCGICTQICPVENIKIINRTPEWQHHCENCYACYVWCPNNAIYGEIVAYNKNIHHPEVKISDMLKNKSIT